MIRIAMERTAFAPGDRIRGEASWTDLPPGTASLEVRLIWYTLGKGDRDFDVVAAMEIAAPAPVGKQEFAFATPQYPYSFSGKLVSLQWAIEVIALPDESAEQATIVIGPARREQEIHEAAGEPQSGSAASDLPLSESDDEE